MHMLYVSVDMHMLYVSMEVSNAVTVSWHGSVY
jgi:hypothetical protein